MVIDMKYVSYGLIGLYVLFNSAGALMIKHQINQLGSVQLGSTSSTFLYFYNLLRNPIVVFGLALIMFAAFAWMSALSRLDISIAYPIAVGMNFVLVVGFGVLLFKEPLSLDKIIGISLIFLSIYFLSKS